MYMYIPIAAPVSLSTSGVGRPALKSFSSSSSEALGHDGLSSTDPGVFGVNCMGGVCSNHHVQKLCSRECTCACTLYYKHLNTNFVECKSRVFAIDEHTWEVSLPAAVTTVISVVDGDELAV